MDSKLIRNYFQECLAYLNQNDFPDAQVTVLFVFEYVLADRYVVLLGQDYCLNNEQCIQIKALLDQCLLNQPLAYVLGEAYFKNVRYVIQPGVLIPRPETEALVDYSAQLIQQVLTSGNVPVIFECGVGSGVISIELAKRFPQLNFHAWDISDIAIKVTKENMALQSVSNIQLSHGDFFDLFHSKVTESPIILISNPPYISALDYENLSTQVLKEPKEALLAEDYGLRVIDQLIQVAKNYNFILLSEIGYDQKQRLERAWIDLPLQFKLDFAGKYRYLIYFSDNHAQQYNL